jgi:hypothetical protein
MQTIGSSAVESRLPASESIGFPPTRAGPRMIFARPLRFSRCLDDDGRHAFGIDVEGEEGQPSMRRPIATPSG